MCFPLIIRIGRAILLRPVLPGQLSIDLGRLAAPVAVPFTPFYNEAASQYAELQRS
jgi:hypothetical protein